MVLGPSALKVSVPSRLKKYNVVAEVLLGPAGTNSEKRHGDYNKDSINTFGLFHTQGCPGQKSHLFAPTT